MLQHLLEGEEEDGEEEEEEEEEGAVDPITIDSQFGEYMSASLKDAFRDADFEDNDDEVEYETCGESMLEQARKQVASERNVSDQVYTDDIRLEVKRMKDRLVGVLGVRDFETAYRVVGMAAGEDEDDLILDLAEVIGMDQLHLLPRLQDLQALEAELARRL